MNPTANKDLSNILKDVQTTARPLRALSLGAGVQSSVIALMAAKGEIQAPDVAIFADTQSEPQSVYAWLDWLEGQLPFPVIRATHGSLAESEGRRMVRKRDGAQYVKVNAPYWAWDPEKQTSGGPMGRNCTRDFKVRVINRTLRKMLGIFNKKTPSGVLAESWLGISTDEASRMKPSRDPWVQIKWPLIDLGMSRQDCIDWAKRNSIPEPPRSACVFCPFHSPEEWMRLQTEEPSAYEAAAAHEDRIRSEWAAWTNAPDMAKDFFAQFHVPGVSLRDIDWVAFIESGESSVNARLEWNNECEGLCGI